MKIGDICTKICSGGTPTSSVIEYYNGNIPWLNTKEICFNRVYSTEKNITQLGYESSAAKLIPRNSVIIAMYGATAAKCCINKIPLTTNQACCNLIIDEAKSDYNFVYYYMCSKYNELQSLANGAAQQNLNTQIIKDFELPSLSLTNQKAIAAVLSALDDKIEVNRAINKNLEETAQAIFKSWFVGFEPFGGVMPADWRIGTFSDIVKTTFGGDWGKEIPEGNHTKQVFCIRGADIPEVKLGNKGKMPIRYILSQNYALKQLTVGDIVIEISGGSPTQSTGRVCYISQALLDRYDRGIVCTNFCRAIKTKEHFSQFVYYYLQYLYTGDVFFSYENGTTGIKNFDLSGFLKTKEIVIPSSNYLYKFNELCLSVFAKTFSIGLQIQRLAEIRDALLPKLMSGEIDVSQVKI